MVCDIGCWEIVAYFAQIVYQLPSDVRINKSDLMMLNRFTIIFGW
jgi:hypothetical protein